MDTQGKGKWWTLLGGAGLGAAVRYLFDPDRGRRRRALLRDQLVSFQSNADDTIKKTATDLRNRLRGLVGNTRLRLGREQVADSVLVERVRAKMGRVISHPSAVEVAADQGRVTLSGPILEGEVDRLLSIVRFVPGVRAVESRLEAHTQAGAIPGLQGGVRRLGHRPDMLQEVWAPGTRFLAGISGGGLAIYGLQRRGRSGLALGALGLGLLARGITNMSLSRLLGIGAGREAIQLQKTINIATPVEEVFSLWTDIENFPYLMAHVKEIREIGMGRSRWTISGPLGLPVTWEAITTEVVPTELLAWETAPGTLVPNAGSIHFQRNPDSTTRLDVKLSYTPPGGLLGHLVASLLDSDPKSIMDEDLVRVKSLLELGKTSAHGERITREELGMKELQRGSDSKNDKR